VAAARAAAYTFEQLAISLGSQAEAAPAGCDEPRGHWEALREENRQLREALESRSAIERAKGVLMGRYGCTEQEAFTLLATTARRQQRKVRLIANDLLVGIGIPGIEQGADALPATVTGERNIKALTIKDGPGQEPAAHATAGMALFADRGPGSG